ncbi:hypothetical protein TNCV_915881 [Trichonephila clavipes]|nr:hypothetical protein TNCV_915881 [Trichonephila clavipes]
MIARELTIAADLASKEKRVANGGRREGVHERMGNPMGYRISSKYRYAVRVSRMAIKDVLLLNKIVPQIITPGCCAVWRMTDREISNRCPGYFQPRLH